MIFLHKHNNYKCIYPLRYVFICNICTWKQHMVMYLCEAPETNVWLTTAVCLFQEYQGRTHGLCPMYAAGNSQFWEEWRSSGFPFWFVSSLHSLPPLSQSLLFPIVLHGNSACGCGMYNVQYILQMWIIVEIRQMKYIFQNYLVIYELQYVTPWFRNTQHSMKCLHINLGSHSWKKWKLEK